MQTKSIFKGRLPQAIFNLIALLIMFSSIPHFFGPELIFYILAVLSMLMLGVFARYPKMEWKHLLISWILLLAACFIPLQPPISLLWLSTFASGLVLVGLYGYAHKHWE